MIVTLKELLNGVEGGVASFNCVDLEMARGCLDAAEAENRPVILGLASRHWEALGGRLFIPSLKAFCEAAKVPVALHLDHVSPDQVGLISEALESGFSSVMIDGSKLPYDGNAAVTKTVVAEASRYGASVEAELGPLPGQEGVAGEVDASEIDKYTDPVEAKRFCRETAVDALAVAVGTAHGLYKDAPEIQLDLISKISALVGIPLVLHGATGVPDSAIRGAVARGVKKINFFSGLLVAAMDRVRAFDSTVSHDYVGFRKELRNAWRETAAAMIRLYKG